MTKLLSKNFILVFLILVPAFFVFSSFFNDYHLAWGDAPFYYTEGLIELVNKPSVWTEKGIPFGGINLALWLSPIMILYGSLNQFFNFNNDLIIRIIFYFPSIIFGFLGTFALTKYLKLSKVMQFFSVLIYIFNTYYLLLVDGGQVGVALAYGVFPIAILFWRKYFDKPGVKSFFIALLGSTMLTYIDPRVTIILYMLMFMWAIFDSRSLLFKKLSGLVLSEILLIPLNIFWLVPFFLSGANGLSSSVSDLHLSSILNSLMLFAPHWPLNSFGKVIPPYFYFSLLPIMIFGGFLFKKIDRKYYFYAFTFLIFAFIAKGSTPPFGITFGTIFRDSSKFFIPLMLFGGMLIGHTVEKLLLYIKNKTIRILIFIGCYLYLLLLIAPSILNKLNFNLSMRQESGDYEIIYDHLKNEEGSFRTLWFTDKPQIAFETIDKPALSASQLTSFRPFSSINNSEDVYNFLNNPEYVNRLKVLGVKYIFLSGDPRNVLQSQGDVANWNTVVNLIESTNELIKVNWGTEMSIYEIPDPNNFITSTNQILAVIGPDLKETSASIYLEDGKIDPKLLLSIDEESIKIIFNNSNKTDLVFTFLQKYFKSIDDFYYSEWAIYTPDKYLKSKYELLIRDYIYNDFDYGKGLAFSTKMGEKLKYKFNISTSGNYIVAKRIGSLDNQKFSWILEKKFLENGVFEYEIENKSGFLVLNTVAVVPEEEYETSVTMASELISKFEENIKNKKNNKWYIFTQNFDPKLTLGGSNIHLPIYSMVNGFYVEDNIQSFDLTYETQKYVDAGLKISLASVLALTVSYLGYAVYAKSR